MHRTPNKPHGVPVCRVPARGSRRRTPSTRAHLPSMLRTAGWPWQPSGSRAAHMARPGAALSRGPPRMRRHAPSFHGPHPFTPHLPPPPPPILPIRKGLKTPLRADTPPSRGGAAAWGQGQQQQQQQANPLGGGQPHAQAWLAPGSGAALRPGSAAQPGGGSSASLQCSLPRPRPVQPRTSASRLSSDRLSSMLRKRGKPGLPPGAATAGALGFEG